MSNESRAQLLQRFATESFDLCIIGGGASGAGCALDAALRGLKVALVEREDFAAGTSSRSTKLVHGGVRYLEQAFKKLDFAQLRQVRHGLEERHRVLANAPHLARPIGLLTPVFSWREGLYFSIGLFLYDCFAAHKDALPASRWLSGAEARKRMPALSPRVHSAVLYYDGQLDDARYCLALAQSAAQAGAVVLNHVEVFDFQKDEDGKIISAHFRDALQAPAVQTEAPVDKAESLSTQPSKVASQPLGYEIQARCFLNCTGPFADQVRHLANPSLAHRIRPSKGVHAVLPRSALNSDDAMLIPKTPDGRMVFAIPFQGQILLGTTDEDWPDTAQEPVLEVREVEFLLNTLNPFLERPVGKEQVKAGFGGLRPLLAPFLRSKAGVKTLLRDHEVETDSASGLISLLGGKWTTYRLMAEDAINAACQQLKHMAPCLTKEHILVGGVGYTADFWKKIQSEYGLDPEIAQHLARQYGTRAGELLKWTQATPIWAAPLVAGFPFLKVEVIYAVRCEMACTLRDVLARRIRLEVLDWQAALEAAPETARLMAPELNWSPEQKSRELADYQSLLKGFVKSATSSEV